VGLANPDGIGTFRQVFRLRQQRDHPATFQRWAEKFGCLPCGPSFNDHMNPPVYLSEVASAPRPSAVAVQYPLGSIDFGLLGAGYKTSRRSTTPPPGLFAGSTRGRGYLRSVKFACDIAGTPINPKNAHGSRPKGQVNKYRVSTI